MQGFILDDSLHGRTAAARSAGCPRSGWADIVYPETLWFCSVRENHASRDWNRLAKSVLRFCFQMPICFIDCEGSIVQNHCSCSCGISHARALDPGLCCRLHIDRVELYFGRSQVCLHSWSLTGFSSLYRLSSENKPWFTRCIVLLWLLTLIQKLLCLTWM